MTKKIEEIELADLLEPCGRCEAAGEAKPAKPREAVTNETKEFSIADSKSCPMCHGSKKVLNKLGFQFRRIAVQLRDNGYLRP